jgi:NhaP-type Na+/H+ or K+/H+ antiporter
VPLAPELLLLLVLPPLIYSSAVAMSWREFRFNLRPISQLAIGCVVFTTMAVAAATHLSMISAATRLQGIFFWAVLVYLIEGMVFLITGLQTRTVIMGIGGNSFSALAGSAAVVSVVVILGRFVWMFPATYLPRWLIPSIARNDPEPPCGWTAMLKRPIKPAFSEMSLVQPLYNPRQVDSSLKAVTSVRNGSSPAAISTPQVSAF